MRLSTENIVQNERRHIHAHTHTHNSGLDGLQLAGWSHCCQRLKFTMQVYLRCAIPRAVSTATGYRSALDTQAVFDLPNPDSDSY